MTKNSIKLLSLIIAVIMALTVVPAFASDAVVLDSGIHGENGISWTLYEDGNLVFEGSGAIEGIDKDSTYTVPAWEGNALVEVITVSEGITEIGKYVFSSCAVKEVYIADSVNKIGEKAFYDCSSLINVNGLKNVGEIGAQAFCYCRMLENISVSDKLTYIGDKAFNSCHALKDFSFTDSLTYIGSAAFSACNNLKDIYIGKEVAFIGDGAFSATDRVTAFEVHPENASYYSDEYGALYGNEQSVLMYYPVANTRTEYIIPSDITAIADSALMEAMYLESIKLPENLKTIGNQAFYGCMSLKELTLPETLEAIGGYAFAMCFDITKVVIPDSVTEVGLMAFYFCPNIRSVEIGKGCLIDTPEYAFHMDSRIKTITVDSENPYYSSDEYGVLYNKDKTQLLIFPPASPEREFVIPDTVKEIGFSAFFVGDIENVTIPASVTSIAPDNFYECPALREVNILSDSISFSGGDFSSSSNVSGILPSDLFAESAYINKYVFMGSDELATKAEREIKKYITENPRGISVEVFNFHDDSKTYAAETFAEEKGIEINRCHFYEEEWTYDYDNLVRYKNCTVEGCDAALSEALEKNSENGAEIISPEDPDTDLSVEVIPGNDERFILIEEALDGSGKNYTVLKAFDINFKNKDGVHVQPDGTVKVKLPLDWEKDGNYKVFRINDDKTLTDMGAVRQGSHMVFETDHFSIYVIVEETAEPEIPEEETTKPEIPEEETTGGSSQGGKKDVFGFLTKLIQALSDFFMRILTFLGL